MCSFSVSLWAKTTSKLVALQLRCQQFLLASAKFLTLLLLTLAKISDHSPGSSWSMFVC